MGQDAKAAKGAGISPVHVRPSLRWAYFAVMNLVAAGLAIGIFQLVYHADFLDEGSEVAAAWFFEHPGVSSIAAAAPMLVTVLIGLHYARRGARRRAAAKAAEVTRAGGE